MKNTKILVARLSDHYWDLEDTIDTIMALGNVGSEEITLLRDLQVNIDNILTNVSKRWAKGKKDDLRNA